MMGMNNNGEDKIEGISSTRFSLGQDNRDKNNSIYKNRLYRIEHAFGLLSKYCFSD